MNSPKFYIIQNGSVRSVVATLYAEKPATARDKDEQSHFS